MTPTQEQIDGLREQRDAEWRAWKASGFKPKRRKRKASSYGNVINRLDVAQILKDHLAKIADNKITYDIACQFIDAGYRTMAIKLHPDKGGSLDAMQRLNDIKQSVKKFTDSQWKAPKSTGRIQQNEN